jgi:hypothetical protein
MILAVIVFLNTNLLFFRGVDSLLTLESTTPAYFAPPPVAGFVAR